MTDTVPSMPLVKAIDKSGLRPREFAKLSGVSEKTLLDWRRGFRDATWWTADAALLALGLHWWDVWAHDTPAGHTARALWEGELAWVVACEVCGLEDARTGDRRDALSGGCSRCGRAVHVVDGEAAVAS